MDKQPILPESPTAEEPPLQQTPEMLNQQPQQEQQPVQPQEQPLQPQEQPLQPQDPHHVDPTPPERPPEMVPERKTGLIILISIIALVVIAIVAGAIYWFTVLGDVNRTIDEQGDGSENVSTYITNEYELIAAYDAETRLDCSYNIDMDGGSYEVSEQADSGWRYHKITIVGDESVVTTLEVKDDAVYTWGYLTAGDEFAFKMPWNEYTKTKNSDLSDSFITDSQIIENRDSLTNLVCLIESENEDYKIPERDWVNVGE